MTDLKGKTAVVLGASAEAGTGWAIAEALAAAGAKVVVGARSLSALQKLAGKIGGKAVSCDAGQGAQVEALMQAAVDAYGRLDIAVNAAGTPSLGMIADSSEEAVKAALDVNYLANLHFIKHAARCMDAGSSIIIISSLSTTHPLIPNFAYSCAKAATDCLVRYAALEYGRRRIRVNSIQPGPIVSDMSKALFASPDVVKVFEREIPLGQLGYPADFANAVLWLAGPAYVTGANLPICGGGQLTRFPYLSELPGASDSWTGV